MSKQCSNCKHENRDRAEVCEDCSALLEPSTVPKSTELEDLETFSLNKGDLVAGRYQIMEEISHGVLGILYQVKDTHFREQYLHLKMLHPLWSSDPLERKRFSDEINICIDPVNPPQIQVDHRENGQSIYFYLTGPSLQDYIDQQKGNVPLFSLSEIRTVIISLLDILDYAHQYTVHNKISPSTIIVVGSFPDVSIRLLDYGLGDEVPGSRARNTPTYTGSYLYIAQNRSRYHLKQICGRIYILLV